MQARVKWGLEWSYCCRIVSIFQDQVVVVSSLNRVAIFNFKSRQPRLNILRGVCRRNEYFLEPIFKPIYELKSRQPEISQQTPLKNISAFTSTIHFTDIIQLPSTIYLIRHTRGVPVISALSIKSGSSRRKAARTKNCFHNSFSYKGYANHKLFSL